MAARGASVVVLLAAVFSTAANGHEMRSLHLRLDETAPGRVEVTLKLPLTREGRIPAARPVLPTGCRSADAAAVLRTDEFIVRRWTATCSRPLRGETLAIEGFDGSVSDAIVTVRLAGGEELLLFAGASAPRVRIGTERSSTPLRGYVPLGIEHILLGPDHLLFVLGLLLVVRRSGAGARTLLATVTAFTVAHSITLALAVLGGVALSATPVETGIAASILLLAVELAVEPGRSSARRPPSLVFRRPWVVAFTFGLLHGFGFAGALSEVGLPDGLRAVALLLFNVGVEVGQLLFVAGAALLAALVARIRSGRTWDWEAAAVTVLGVASAYWLIDRVVPLVASGIS